MRPMSGVRLGTRRAILRIVICIYFRFQASTWMPPNRECSASRLWLLVEAVVRPATANRRTENNVRARRKAKDLSYFLHAVSGDAAYWCKVAAIVLVQSVLELGTVVWLIDRSVGKLFQCHVTSVHSSLPAVRRCCFYLLHTSWRHLLTFYPVTTYGMLLFYQINRRCFGALIWPLLLLCFRLS